MGELLSHSEIETLFPRVERPRQLRPESNGANAHGSDGSESASWETLSFREPEPLSRDAIELLQALHAGLCQNLAHRFQSLLHTPVEFLPVGMIQAGFDDDDSEGVSVDVMCQITGPSLAPWLISWSSELAQAFFTRLLGGADSAAGNGATTFPSEIEVRLLHRLCCAVFEEVWRLTEPEPPQLPLEVRVISRPLRTHCDFATTPHLCASFEIVCGRDRGMLHCWLPGRHLLEASHSKFSADSIEPKSGTLAEQAKRARVELAVDLARFKLSVSEIASLAVGDVLMSDVTRQDGASLRLADRTLFQVGLGTHHDRKAVCLLNSPPSTKSSVSPTENPKNR